MKRINVIRRIAIAAIVIGLGFAHANGQNFMHKIKKDLSGGIKAEANLSTFILSDMPDTKSNMNIGSTFGVFVKFDLSKHFAIQEDILASYKTLMLEQENVKSDYHYWGMEINIYALGQWKLKGNDRIYLGVGPCTEYGISADLETKGTKTDMYKEDPVTGKAPMTKLNIGAGLMIGYEFSCRIQMNAGYRIGFTNILDAGNDNSSMFPSKLSLGIGYRF